MILLQNKEFLIFAAIQNQYDNSNFTIIHKT